MRIFKVTLLLAVIFGSVGYSGYAYVAGPCRNPVEYSLGSFDGRFGISRESFLSAAEEAEGIWEKALDHELFTLVPERGDVSLNLVYDVRQETADKNAALGETVDENKSVLELKEAALADMKLRYESLKTEYESLVASFERRQSAYNARVNGWNAKDGAPKSAYEELKNEKTSLESLADTVERKRLTLNALADDLNETVAEYNRVARSVNSAIETINESADKEFEQGEYVAKGWDRDVNIYEFTKRSELVRVLAHEFAHVLGADHNANAESIMYYLNAGESLVPTDEDVLGIKAACRLR